MAEGQTEFPPFPEMNVIFFATENLVLFLSMEESMTVGLSVDAKCKLSF